MQPVEQGTQLAFCINPYPVLHAVQTVDETPPPPPPPPPFGSEETVHVLQFVEHAVVQAFAADVEAEFRPKVSIQLVQAKPLHTLQFPPQGLHSPPDK